MAKQAVKAKRAVRGSRTGRPIMVLLDLLGRRWTLRILWELREGALTSRALREACDDASPTVLQARLADLRQAGFVELVPAATALRRWAGNCTAPSCRCTGSRSGGGGVKLRSRRGQRLSEAHPEEP